MIINEIKETYLAPCYEPNGIKTYDLPEKRTMLYTRDYAER